MGWMILYFGGATFLMIKPRIRPLATIEERVEDKKYNTKYSHVVTHRSTDLALPSLAYKIERVCAFSRRYGRIYSIIIIIVFIALV